VLECVLNLSEGRDLDRVTRLAQAAGPSLRDLHSDAFHNRSVLTLINPVDELERDVRGLIDATFRLLDLEHHEGVHPRLGVVDVVPFVPLAPATMDSATRLRQRTAQWVASTFDVPVFLYGPLDGVERSLPFVRAHAFKDLVADFGPALADVHRGAVVVGARDILVAWNLWLSGVSLDEARGLARMARRPGLRALGLQVGDQVQVSCNIVDVEMVTPSQVFDLVKAHLPLTGAIERAELVGLAPRSVLQKEDRARWAQLDLSEDATIESRLAR